MDKWKLLSNIKEEVNIDTTILIDKNIYTEDTVWYNESENENLTMTKEIKKKTINEQYNLSNSKDLKDFVIFLYTEYKELMEELAK